MSETDLTTRIKALIAKNDLAKVYQLLITNYTQSDQLDYLLQQSGQYHSLRQAQQQGVIDFEEQQKALNKLTVNILAFLNDHPISIATNKKDPKKLWNAYQLAQVRISTLRVLQVLHRPETISTIFQLAKVKQRKFVVQTLHELTAVGLMERIKEGKHVKWELTEAGKKFVDSLFN